LKAFCGAIDSDLAANPAIEEDVVNPPDEMKALKARFSNDVELTLCDFDRN
jgi:hypothetical protein